MQAILRVVSTFVNMMAVSRTEDPDTRLLQGAADPTRLAILRRLAGESEVCACEFTECCDVTQPTVSHHLKVLRESGWVTSQRRGLWVWYRLRPEAVDRLGSIAAGFAPLGSPGPGSGMELRAPMRRTPPGPAR